MVNSRKVAALDIDGTVVDYNGYITRGGERYFNTPVIKPSGYDLTEKFGVTEEEADGFWYENYNDYTLNCPLLDGVVEATKWLHYEMGYSIVVASHRLLGIQKNGEVDYHFEKQGMTKEVALQRVKDLVESAGIPVDSYFCPSRYMSKADICNTIRAQFLFDDHPEEVPRLHAESSTTPILISQPYNEHVTQGIILRDWKKLKDEFPRFEAERKGQSK